MKTFMRSSLGWLFATFMPVCLMALHGVITHDTTWADVVYIDGDIVIGPGLWGTSVDLNIEPGTVILFDAQSSAWDTVIAGRGTLSRCDIFVYWGTMVAQGTQYDSIYFKSNAVTPAAGDWGKLITDMFGETYLSYVVIEYGTGLDIVERTQIAHARITGLAGEIWITGSHDSTTFIDSCWINNHGTIWVIQGWGGECKPYITNNIIENGFCGIVCQYSKAKPWIANNIIRNNAGNGIQCNVGAAPIVTHNLITGNGVGVMIIGDASPDLGGGGSSPGLNDIFDNAMYAVYNSGTLDIYAQNNWWGTTDTVLINEYIYDKRDSAALGMVYYIPYSTAPNIGVEETIVDNFDIMVYPNPCAEYLHIKYNVNDDVVLKMYDITGRVVDDIILNSGEHSITLDVSRLSAGTYFIKPVHINVGKICRVVIIK